MALKPCLEGALAVEFACVGSEGDRLGWLGGDRYTSKIWFIVKVSSGKVRERMRSLLLSQPLGAIAHHSEGLGRAIALWLR